MSHEKKEYNDRLAEFLMSELADLTNKIDSLDQGIQFFVQLYITIIAASIALLAKELVFEGQYMLCSIFWLALTMMGYYVLRYTLSGMESHFEYINRSNLIRRRILENLCFTDGEIEGYGYTSVIEPKVKGMKFWRIRFLEACVSAFSGASVFFLILHYGFLDVTEHIILVSTMFFFGIFFMLQSKYETVRKKMSEDGRQKNNNYHDSRRR